MLSRPQQIMFKRAQAEAKLSDLEYRDALDLVAGVRSSKDPRLTDRQFDQVMSYLEAICWRGRDAGTIQQPGLKSVFARRGYWASKNPSGNTSRDRYAGSNVQAEIRELEDHLDRLGFGAGYRQAIRTAVLGRSAISPSSADLQKYRAALARTVRTKSPQAAAAPAECPF